LTSKSLAFLLAVAMMGSVSVMTTVSDSAAAEPDCSDKFADVEVGGPNGTLLWTCTNTCPNSCNAQIGDVVDTDRKAE
jgi:hypothetical protein